MPAVVALLLAAGCRGGVAGGGASSGTTVDLTYTAGGVVKTQSLDCRSGGAEGASCELIERLPADVFEPVAADRMCTMIFGGPETATITGMVNGNRVAATFSRVNGCEISRFAQVEPLFAEMAGN